MAKQAVCGNTRFAFGKRGIDDILTKLKADYVGFGMMHFVDEADGIINNKLMAYARELKGKGITDALVLAFAIWMWRILLA